MIENLTLNFLLLIIHLMKKLRQLKKFYTLLIYQKFILSGTLFEKVSLPKIQKFKAPHHKSPPPTALVPPTFEKLKNIRPS